MKFLKGLLFGSIAGFAAGVAISEERRVALIRRVRSVTREAGGVEPPEPVAPRTEPSTPAAVG